MSPPPAPPRVSLTGRAAVLGIVLLVLGISFAYPLRNYFGQRAELSDLRAQQATQEQTLQGLRDQIEQWNDPAYVETLARERLHFVRPGETLYVVVDDDPPTESEVATEDITAGGSEWWQRLWSTVEQAEVAVDDGTGAPTEADPGAGTGTGSGG